MDRLEILRAKQKTVQAKAMEGSLRDGRPEHPPERGSVCERCGDVTEEIQCFRVDYWLCPGCLMFHQGIEIKAALMAPSLRP